MTSTSNFKQRTLEDYAYRIYIATRFGDVDRYAHVNNTVYNGYVDTIVNEYLITQCGLLPESGEAIGLVVESWMKFYTPVSFPGKLQLALRVTKIGTSSVNYEVGMFPTGSKSPAAVGGFTHVFVDRLSRKSRPMPEEIRSGLEKIQISVARL